VAHIFQGLAQVKVKISLSFHLNTKDKIEEETMDSIKTLEYVGLGL